MRNSILAVAAAAFMAFPAAGLSATPSHAASASCKAQLQASGRTNFDAKYKTEGDCISDMSKLTATQRLAVLSAEKTCRAAQTASPTAFEARYGSTTKSGKTSSQEDAFGKCVSATASA